jgi:hypothetical protein
MRGRAERRQHTDDDQIPCFLSGLQLAKCKLQTEVAKGLIIAKLQSWTTQFLNHDDQVLRNDGALIAQVFLV